MKLFRVPSALFLIALLAAASNAENERDRLQGIWESAPGAPTAVKLIVFGDKVGYQIGDPTATPAKPGTSFVGASPAKFSETGGKHFAEIAIAKDYAKKVEFRLDKNGLVFTVEGKDYPLHRVNTRGEDPIAKKFSGTWTVTDASFAGKSATPKQAGLESITFSGDRYIWKAPDGKEIINMLYRLGEPKTGPAELDVYGQNGQVAIPAIVDVNGDKITIVQPLKPAGAARPKSLDDKCEVLVIHAEKAK